MRTWIEVEDSSGRRLGVILHATGWTFNEVKNGAGSFSFQVPVGPADELLQVYRVVKCYQQVAGETLQSLGAGVIESLTYVEGPAPLWQVAGGDLLRELAFRSVDGLELMDLREEHPAECYSKRILYDDQRLELTKMLDWQVRDTSTDDDFPGDGHPLSNTDGNRGYIYVHHARAFKGVRFTIVSTPSPVASYGCTLAADYWNSTAGAWQTLSIEDGTQGLANGHVCTLAYSGVVSWELPSDWGIATDEVTYKVRFYVNSNAVTGTVEIADAAVIFNGPTNDALRPLMAYAPAGWSLDAEHGYTEIQAAQNFGADLVANGGFEQHGGYGPVQESMLDNGLMASVLYWTLWTPYNTRIEWTADVHGGAAALKIIALHAVSDSAYLWQDITVQAGKSYLLTFWTHSGGTVQGSYQVQAKIAGKWVLLTNVQDTGVVATAWAQVKVTFTAPNDCATIRLYLYGSHEAGAVYVDDVALHTCSGGEVYQTLVNETLLGALVKVAEQSGESFVKSPSGRQVLWLGRDRRLAAVRAIGPMTPGRTPNTSRHCRIASLQKMQNAYDLVTRVQPVGAGVGDSRITLADTSRTAPSGFMLAGGWLINAALETAIGYRIEKLLEYNEIKAQNSSASQREFAANQLFDRALEFLYNHLVTNLDPILGDLPTLYQMTLASCPEMLHPGWLLRTIWARKVAGHWSGWIDGELWIQRVTVTVAQTGATTVGVQVSTVPMTPAPATDAGRVAAELRKARQARSYG